MSTEMIVHPGVEESLANARAMSPEDKRAIAGFIGIAEDHEAFIPFLSIAQQLGLNPIMGEIWLIDTTKNVQVNGSWEKGPKKYTPSVGRDGLLKHARRTPGYRGFKADVVHANDEFVVEHNTEDILAPPRILHRTASPTFKDDQGRQVGRGPIIGAWAICYVDHRPPVFYFAPINEHGKMTRDGKNWSGAWSSTSAMITKCYDPETEVLTEAGFRKFAEIAGERVLQVTDAGLEPVSAPPFRMDYGGPMVRCDGDQTNFCVTPNHEMELTERGERVRIEASEMFERARQRPVFRVPRITPCEQPDLAVSDGALRLAGYVLADGTVNAGHTVYVSVGRERKVSALDELDLHYGRVLGSQAGRPAAVLGRVVTANLDTFQFRYRRAALEGLVETDGRRGKWMTVEKILLLSRRQARLLLDSWIEFDGSTAGTSTSLTNSYPHLQDAVELLAVQAGYAISRRKHRRTERRDRVGWSFSLRDELPLRRIGRAYRSNGSVESPSEDGKELRLAPNEHGEVWCVTVPSGKIVVRRNGFSMICGNSAVSYVHRLALGVTGILPADEIIKETPALTGGGVTQLEAGPGLWVELKERIGADAAVTLRSVAERGGESTAFSEMRYRGMSDESLVAEALRLRAAVPVAEAPEAPVGPEKEPKEGEEVTPVVVPDPSPDRIGEEEAPPERDAPLRGEGSPLMHKALDLEAALQEATDAEEIDDLSRELMIVREQIAGDQPGQGRLA